MEQKIIQIGNSTGVIIPKTLLKQAGLKAGAQVIVQTDPDGGLVILKKGQKMKRTALNAEFFELLEDINKEYGPALKELAQK